MRDSGIGRFCWEGWRKFATLGVLVLVLVLALDGLAGRDLRVWWLLRGYEDDPTGTLDELRRLDPGYHGALHRALLRGCSRFDSQLALTLTLMQRPFYARGAVREALEDDDPVIRRAAAVALLRREAGPRRGPIPDEIMPIVEDWCAQVTDPWLDQLLIEIDKYRDPRLVRPLLDLVAWDGAAGAELLDIGRANHNRALAARRLVVYVGEDDRVAEVLREVVGREHEGNEVQIRAAQALLSAGYDGDVEIYEHLSRSTDPILRQVLADNLESVKDPRVVPILLRLLDDPKETVRRGAVNSLMRKRVPALMDEIWYLAEDQFSSIKGDLAMAVGDYRRKDLIPYLVWCLEDFDPVVVEKAYVELVRLTKEHHGLTAAEWQRYERGNYPIRAKLVKDFMNDAERKEAAVCAWSEEYPPRYRDADRVPHLIRMLGHADRENVRRAIKELARITGRTTGFPPAVLDKNPDPDEEANQFQRFFTEGRKAVIGDWKRWCEESWPLDTPAPPVKETQPEKDEGE